MSFSASLKAEIIENKPLRARYKQAQAYGLFAFSKSFSEQMVCIATENLETARLYGGLLKDFLGKDTDIARDEKLQSGKPLYTVRLTERESRERLIALFGHTEGAINCGLLPSQEHVGAFLGGVYLACGHMTDPNKSYHVEFVVRDEPLCDTLKSLLDSVLSVAKKTARRGSFVIYYKERAQLEDLLTLMGAHKSSLAVIEIEMMKDVRNSANRATNCETANIDKLVAASAGQIADIKLVLEQIGEQNLPENLRIAARLRQENPEASLRELSDMAEPKISRSGMFHRFSKLAKMAEDIRAQNKNNSEGAAQ